MNLGKLYISNSRETTAAAAAKSLQSCPTLCDRIDGSPPGSPVPGILQARTLEWVAISFSNARRWKAKVKSLSRVRLLATPWTVAHQAPPFMGFSRHEYWSGVPLPSLTPYTNLPLIMYIGFLHGHLLMIFWAESLYTTSKHYIQWIAREPFLKSCYSPIQKPTMSCHTWE